MQIDNKRTAATGTWRVCIVSDEQYSSRWKGAYRDIVLQNCSTGERAITYVGTAYKNYANWRRIIEAYSPDDEQRVTDVYYVTKDRTIARAPNGMSLIDADSQPVPVDIPQDDEYWHHRARRQLYRHESYKAIESIAEALGIEFDGRTWNPLRRIHEWQQDPDLPIKPTDTIDRIILKSKLGTILWHAETWNRGDHLYGPKPKK